MSNRSFYLILEFTKTNTSDKDVLHTWVNECITAAIEKRHSSTLNEWCPVLKPQKRPHSVCSVPAQVNI